VRRTSLAGMCGRYASSRQPEDLVEEFEITLVPDHVPRIEADWNVAPTKEVYAVVERPPRDEDGAKAEEPERQLRVLTWGLVPFWAKDPSVGNKMINARMETVHEKPASCWQSCEQPSPSVVFPSSQASGASFMPSPHWLVQVPVLQSGSSVHVDEQPSPSITL